MRRLIVRHKMCFSLMLLTLIMVLSTDRVSAAARAHEQNVNLELLFRRPDSAQLLLSGDVPSGSVETVATKLSYEGVTVVRHRQMQRAGKQSIVLDINPGGVYAEGVWQFDIGPMVKVFKESVPGTDHLRITLPSSFSPTWIGSIPIQTKAKRLMYTDYVFSRPTIQELRGLTVAPYEQLGRHLVLTSMLGLFSVIVGAVLAGIMSRQISAGKETAWASYVAVPAVIAALIPFQTQYTRWLSAYVDWRVRSAFWGGVSGFAPLLIVTILSFYTILRVQINQWRGQSTYVKRRQGRLLFARLLPLLSTVIINVLILTWTDIMNFPNGIWWLIGIQAGAIFLSFIITPPLAVWAFQAVRISEHENPEIIHFVTEHGVDPGKIFVAPQIGEEPELNAFVMGIPPLHPTIIIAEELLNTLSVDEAKAVLAHEISHARNSHLLQRLILFFGWLIIVPLVAPLAQFNPFLYLPLSSVCLFGLYTMLSRHQEYVADHDAGLMAGPGHMHSALQKIGEGHAHRVAASRWIWWLQPHPFLMHRLERLAQFHDGVPPHSHTHRSKS